MASIIKVDTIQTAAGGTPTAAGLGLNTTGSVLQVVQATEPAVVTTSSTSFVDLGNLSATITPSSTSSKILLTMHIGRATATAYLYSFAFRFVRGSTVVGVGNADGNRIQASTMGAGNASNDSNHTYSTPSMMYLDLPNTTVATTYKVQGCIQGGSTLAINRNQSNPNASDVHAGRTICTLTVMEIAG
jgi:hypothetical protein